MEPITESVNNFYLSQGALGVTCMLLIVALIALWRAREKDRVDHTAEIRAQTASHKVEIAAKDALINELQDQRLEEALVSRDSVKTFQTTMDAFLTAMRGKGLQ